MTIRPEDAGLPREHREHLRQALVQSHEQRIDEALRRVYRPGEPLRVPIAGPEIDAVAETLVQRYRDAGWHRARVERDATQHYVVLDT